MGHSCKAPKRLMWRYIAAKATGTSHLKDNLPCQDMLACQTVPSGGLIAVIADGAGSAKRAGRGAEIAVDSVVTDLTRRLVDPRPDYNRLLCEAAASAREAIATEAARDGASIREYACTLLAVVSGGSGGGALQIGDGVIVAGDGGGEWSWMFWPQRGEYANTTHFLTDEDYVGRTMVDVFPNTLSDVALMSDGLEPLALNYTSKSVHDPFFAGLFQPLVQSGGDGEIEPMSASLERFLCSERVTTRTDDDLSLIAATRRTR